MWVDSPQVVAWPANQAFAVTRCTAPGERLPRFIPYPCSYRLDKVLAMLLLSIAKYTSNMINVAVNSHV